MTNTKHVRAQSNTSYLYGAWGDTVLELRRNLRLERHPVRKARILWCGCLECFDQCKRPSAEPHGTWCKGRVCPKCKILPFNVILVTQRRTS